MRPLLSVLLLSLSFSTQAENLENQSENYTGLWQGNSGTYYSIHQIKPSQNSGSQILVSALNTKSVELSAFEQGNIQFTENLLDIAINGSGFFILLNQDGSELYTRNGKFSIDSEGWIVNEEGYRLKTSKQLPIPDLLLSNKQSRTAIINEFSSSCLTELLPNGIACLTSEDEEEVLSISFEGVISVKDSVTGEMLEHDQIILASIYPNDLRFSGQYFRTDNVSAVVYSPSHTSLQAGALEVRSYTSQTWQAYSANLVDGKGELNSADGIPINDWYGKHIDFTSELTATIKQTCDEEYSYICDMQNDTDDTLTKIY